LIGDIALIVTAIGVLGVVLGLRQNYRERLRQFQGMYVERYWMNLDKLSIDALSGSFPDKITEDDDKAIRSYILLCEDELEMRENGYIAPTAGGRLVRVDLHAADCRRMSCTLTGHPGCGAKFPVPCYAWDPASGGGSGHE